ncbi:hypothetical protein [Leeuwenhoekiella sp. MAR_2009_132]|uniref:hypothetical protein n=1 Tax=Leeuwenhoekiella sp. MAR_2009_132 TaxID=1392489 RepID=UPI000F679265|nr:hypothetical protein [Leeuwenhoekiella sp. MAR_2009_132]
MAPMKFEENIREKLEKREIKPSPLAWKRIENELNHSAKRKNKRSYGWLVMAASFVGILILAGTLFFKSEIPQNQQVVEIPVEKTTTEDNLPENKLTEKQLPHTAKEVVAEVEREDAVKKVAILPENSVVVKKNTEAVALSQKTTKETSLDAPIQNYINEEVDQLLLKVQQQQNTGVAYSDVEIDMLLREAQRDIITEKLFKNAQNEVNAQALLYEVEEELDPSFRDRIFEALKDGFLKAREAVVSRNN